MTSKKWLWLSIFISVSASVCTAGVINVPDQPPHQLEEPENPHDPDRGEEGFIDLNPGEPTAVYEDSSVRRETESYGLDNLTATCEEPAANPDIDPTEFFGQDFNADSPLRDVESTK